jgi:hypothetical protein
MIAEQEKIKQFLEAEQLSPPEIGGMTFKRKRKDFDSQEKLNTISDNYTRNKNEKLESLVNLLEDAIALAKTPNSSAESVVIFVSEGIQKIQGIRVGQVLQIQVQSRQSQQASDPRVTSAVNKFLSYKESVQYQTAKGGAAKPFDVWMQDTFVATGYLTNEELALLPTWAYRQFSDRLYHALFNKKRRVATP